MELIIFIQPNPVSMKESQRNPMDITSEIHSSAPEWIKFLLIKKERRMEAMQLGLRQTRILICFSIACL